MMTDFSSFLSPPLSFLFHYNQSDETKKRVQTILSLLRLIFEMVPESRSDFRAGAAGISSPLSLSIPLLLCSSLAYPPLIFLALLLFFICFFLIYLLFSFCI